MSNETIKTVATVTAATTPAILPKVVSAEIAITRDNVQDSGKARFGAGMMRF